MRSVPTVALVAPLDLLVENAVAAFEDEDQAVEGDGAGGGGIVHKSQIFSAINRQYHFSRLAGTARPTIGIDIGVQ